MQLRVTPARGRSSCRRKWAAEGQQQCQHLGSCAWLLSAPSPFPACHGRLLLKPPSTEGEAQGVQPWSSASWTQQRAEQEVASGDASGLENEDGTASEPADGTDMGEEKVLCPLWWLFESKMQSCGGERDKVGGEETPGSKATRPGANSSCSTDSSTGRTVKLPTGWERQALPGQHSRAELVP